jgi:hypothetical protein
VLGGLHSRPVRGWGLGVITPKSELAAPNMQVVMAHSVMALSAQRLMLWPHRALARCYCSWISALRCDKLSTEIGMLQGRLWRCVRYKLAADRLVLNQNTLSSACAYTAVLVSVALSPWQRLWGQGDTACALSGA